MADDTITFELKTSQVETFMDMLAMASWITGSHHTEEERDAYENEVAAVEQSIVRQVHEAGVSNTVEIVGDRPMSEFGDEGNVGWERFEDYNERLFWEELVGKLSEVALIEKFGEKRLAAMTPEERVSAFHKFEAFFGGLLENSGLVALLPSRPDEMGSSLN